MNKVKSVRIQLSEAGERAAGADGFLHITEGNFDLRFFSKKPVDVEEEEWQQVLHCLSDVDGQSLLEIASDKKAPLHREPKPAKPVCAICEGSGLQVIRTDDGKQFAQPCECRIVDRVERTLKLAGIPKRFGHCEFDTYDVTSPNLDKSLKRARRTAEKFVETYPLENNGTGLLLVGPPGVGKTHLATAILKSLIVKKGAVGLFCDYRDLLKEVQNSYNKQVLATELEVLAPVFEAEVLVIDDLGASKPSEWVLDTVGQILNSRYNDRLTTIITTNFSNNAETVQESLDGLGETEKQRVQGKNVMKGNTLGDRIGERVRSRLQEMCKVVEMNGDDCRQSLKIATF
jgi:DNA replication protein DnaC